MAKPLARYASLTGYAEVARSVGLDPSAMLREGGLDPAGLRTQDRWVPAASIANLFEISAQRSGRPDFALRLSQHRRLSTLGPLSVSLREEPDARSALKLLITYQHLYNEAMHIKVVDHGEISVIAVSIELGEAVPVRQSIELAVAVTYQVLRSLLGEHWRPVSVNFEHSAPADDTTHRKLFDAPLHFDAEFSGIVTYTAALDEQNRMSDPQLRSYAQKLLDSVASPDPPSTVRRVRELVELLLPTGRCSADQVAKSLGVDRRTVHRQLAKSGETFTSVVDAARAELANRLVAGHRYSLTEVSELLAFSNPSSFSRWFRTQFGVSPRQWRTDASVADMEMSRNEQNSVPQR